MNNFPHSGLPKAVALPMYARWAGSCPGHHQPPPCVLFIAPPTPSSPLPPHQSGIAKTVLMTDMRDWKRICEGEGVQI